MTKPKRISAFTPWLIWGLAAFFFFSHYVVRVTPGHIIEELQSTFVDATKLDLGILGTSFYIPYVIMQMPVGYLVDRFGSRLLLTVAVLICSVSSLIFANAVELSTAIFARTLLGFCSAAAFISALKLITVWFEPRQLALLVGITQALGMLGASAGGVLVPYMNNAIGWQSTFYVYSMVFFILCILIFSFVRNRPHNNTITEHHASMSHRSLAKQLGPVIFNKYTWLNALYAGFIFAPTDAMGELWGRDFLRHIHDIPPDTASLAISFLFIGWGIGGPIAGSLADHYGRRRIMLVSAIFGAILLPIIFYVPGIPLYLLMLCMFLYGLTNTGLIASYAAAGELHSKEHAGFSMAIANMFSVLLGSMFMPLLGWLLEWHASNHLVDGELVYTSLDYQRSTIILPICMVIAIFCSFFVKKP